MEKPSYSNWRDRQQDNKEAPSYSNWRNRQQDNKEAQPRIFNNKKKPPLTFQQYIPEEEVLSGLQSGKFLKGIIRVNPKFPQESYVEDEDPKQPDHIITSLLDRNRAMDKDEVILKIKATREDGRHEVEVVYIAQKVHPRLAVGYLKAIPQNPHFAVFTPRDKKIPRMDIAKSDLPQSFVTHPEEYEHKLCLAKISKWTKVKSVRGKIIEILGASGDLKVENLVILKEFCVETNDNFTNFCLHSMEIPKNETFPREDIRRRCVFTIDNPKTEDIDDAISCEKLTNGNYEIGVHIADVSHYVKQNTELDKMVKEKATSVYLVDSVFHMLPTELCSQCSLSPGKDKLTFSVLWEITPDGDIKKRREVKTIINSCAQLSYEQAQNMIDKPNGFRKDNLPTVFNGFSWEDLSNAINSLQNIAVLLKENRRQTYGVRWNSPSVSFVLNDETGEPQQILIEQRIPAQELIEEFMLLTNMAVAEKIYEKFPDVALLRVRDSPNPIKLAQLHQNLHSLGIHINTSSFKEIQESLDRYISDNNFGDTYKIVLNRLIGKCLQPEKYVCSGNLKEVSNFGVGFRVNTHFTSPIRRYADIITHRLLAASLNNSTANWPIEYVSDIAKNCNYKEFQAKKAEQASTDLYLNYYIERHQPYIADAVVFDVKDRSFDVVVLGIGTVIRIYTNNFEDNWVWKAEQVKVVRDNEDTNINPLWQIRITFPKTETQLEKTLVVDVFTVVTLELQKAPKLNILKAKLKRPQ